MTFPNSPTSLNGFIIRSILDSAGKPQLYALNTGTGVFVQLTNTGNNVDPKLTAEGNVVFSSDKSGSFLDYFQTRDGSTPAQLYWPQKAFAGVGDSTFGTPVGGPTLLDDIDTGSGLSVDHLSFGGQTALEVADRYCGPGITISGNQIPASGSVTVTPSSDIFKIAGVHYANSLTGVICGVPCTLSADTTPTYTLTRTMAGAVVACPPGSTFTIDSTQPDRSKMLLVSVGRNTISAMAGSANSAIASAIAFQVARIIAYQNTYVAQYLVNGVMTSATNGIGSTDYATVAAVNAQLALTYPDEYVDAQSPPTTAELVRLYTDIGYTPSTQDNTDMANGVIPRGMRIADLFHPNAIGNQLMLYRFTTAWQNLGWHTMW